VENGRWGEMIEKPVITLLHVFRDTILAFKAFAAWRR